MEPEELIFTTVVFPQKSSEINVLLLVESIRSFAGTLAEKPIWVCTPETSQELSKATKDKLHKLDADLISFVIDETKLPFFFADTIQAIAFAESLAERDTGLIAWLDSNTLVLNEPKSFLLEETKSLGYRPVHHTLIGSRYEEPLDPFWTQIYRSCQIPKDRIFPMVTHVDSTQIRPYFNAGILVTRPTNRLCQIWHDTFFELYQKPQCQEFYHQDKRYEIFIHQAVLSGVILSLFPTEELQELPRTYNYPLHLFREDISDTRPSTLEELVTIRHEGFYKDPDWHKKIPAKSTLKKWIAKQLKQKLNGSVKTV
ncbi:MAG: hypothetical protein ACFE89_02900 [Candidatus Hodarchaeota archaeon]